MYIKMNIKIPLFLVFLVSKVGELLMGDTDGIVVWAQITEISTSFKQNNQHYILTCILKYLNGKRFLVQKFSHKMF